MKRLTAFAAAGAVLLAACGSDGTESSDAASGDTEAAVSETVAPDDEDAGASTAPEPEATDGEAVEASGADEGDESADAAFPVTIDHKFGETTIDAEPERVVSVGFNEHDFLLAIGVTPVGLRDWYGEQPNGVWPWAQDELGDATPDVIAADAINFEQIAALDPDLIVGVWSGMTAEDYELLAAIAPTVAQPDTYDDYGTPWQEQTMILGRATGRTVEARAVVDDLDNRFATIRQEHPEWAGQEASVAFVTETGPGAYTSQDTRSRIMIDLGFEIPEVNDSIDDGSFFLEISPEDLSPLDVDVLIWVAGSQEGLDAIVTELPTRANLDVANEGREVFASIELGGAFSHGSPLSIDFALDALVPEIEAAMDGDPATPVPSAVEIGAVPGAADSSVDGEGDGDGASGATDGGAASAAWSTVFDSTIPFEEKSAFLADAAELEETADAYTAAGDGFGGISLEPTAVAVDGDTATITYDVNFGENPAYGDQVGTITLVDGVWTVSRDEFCSFMSSARVPCG